MESFWILSSHQHAANGRPSLQQREFPAFSPFFIVDDRHFADISTTISVHFTTNGAGPLLTVTLASMNGQTSGQKMPPSAEGWFDYQSHGYIHNIPITEGSTDDFITSGNGRRIHPSKIYE